MAKTKTKAPTKAAKKGYAKAGRAKATPRPRKPASPVTKTDDVPPPVQPATPSEPDNPTQGT